MIFGYFVPCDVHARRRIPDRWRVLDARKGVVQRNSQVADDQQHDDQPGQHDRQIVVLRDDLRPERQGDDGTQQSAYDEVDYEVWVAFLHADLHNISKEPRREIFSAEFRWKREKNFEKFNLRFGRNLMQQKISVLLYIYVERNAFEK